MRLFPSSLLKQNKFYLIIKFLLLFFTWNSFSFFFQINSTKLLLNFLFYSKNEKEISTGKNEKIQKGEKLFLENCLACHQNGNNIIIPEKNLKKSILENNGMNNKAAIIYQITNGKNGMPAFGGRLKENEIKEITNYVLTQQWE